MKHAPIVTNHLVKSEDLNHHGTLYAGRIAEWFVEAGFMAAASYVSTRNLVCVKIHDMVFQHPVYPGEVVCFTGEVTEAGTSSMRTKVRLTVQENCILEGFATFVYVDTEGKPTPHGIKIE